MLCAFAGRDNLKTYFFLIGPYVALFFGIVALGIGVSAIISGAVSLALDATVNTLCVVLGFSFSQSYYRKICFLFSKMCKVVYKKHEGNGESIKEEEMVKNLGGALGNMDEDTTRTRTTSRSQENNRTPCRRASKP